MKQFVGAFAIGLSMWMMPGLAAAQDEGGEGEPAAEPKPEEKESEAVSDKAETTASTDDIAAGEKKIKLGLRLGYGIPMGDAAQDVALSDGYSNMIPIWVDAGYMVTPNIMIGAYFHYAFASINDCPDGVDCSGSDIRFGVQGQYHLSPGQNIQPWFGLGIGYEIASGSVGDTDTSFKGFEFLNLQGGADFKLADAIALGPFLSFSLGQYSTAEVGGVSGDIQNTAIHEWLVIGAKGTFSL